MTTKYRVYLTTGSVALADWVDYDWASPVGGWLHCRSYEPGQVHAEVYWPQHRVDRVVTHDDSMRLTP